MSHFCRFPFMIGLSFFGGGGGGGKHYELVAPQIFRGVLFGTCFPSHLGSPLVLRPLSPLPSLPGGQCHRPIFAPGYFLVPTFVPSCSTLRFSLSNITGESLLPYAYDRLRGIH